MAGAAGNQLEQHKWSSGRLDDGERKPVSCRAPTRNQLSLRTAQTAGGYFSSLRLDLALIAHQPSVSKVAGRVVCTNGVTGLDVAVGS